MEATDIKQNRLEFGGEIIRNGIEEYHEDARLGSTVARMMLRSPAHARLEMNKKHSLSTPAQVFGIAAHYAILEPDEFEKKVAVEPTGINKRTKSGAAEYEGWLFENSGKVIISARQAAHIERMGSAVRKHSAASSILKNGFPEASFFWKDPETDIECKCRPDYLREGHIIVDVKTCEDASFFGFQRQLTNLKYHFQASWYLSGVSEVTQRTYDTFLIIAVEKSPPYGVAVYALDHATIEIGDILRRKALKRFRSCLESDHWPGYPATIEPMNLSPWGFKEGEIYEYFDRND